MEYSWKWSALDLFFYFVGLAAMLVLHLDVLSGNIEFEIPSCEDPSISYRHAESTIPLKYVLMLCIIVPIVIIFFLEYLAVINHSTTRTPRQPWITLKEAMTRASPITWHLVIGGLFTSLLVEVAKFCTSQPRPYFWDVCGDCEYLR